MGRSGERGCARIWTRSSSGDCLRWDWKEQTELGSLFLGRYTRSVLPLQWVEMFMLHVLSVPNGWSTHVLCLLSCVLLYSFPFHSPHVSVTKLYESSLPYLIFPIVVFSRIISEFARVWLVFYIDPPLLPPISFPRPPCDCVAAAHALIEQLPL